MRIGFAYLCVILLWATTPLAIKWSIADIGFLFGVISRNNWDQKSNIIKDLLFKCLSLNKGLAGFMVC